MIRIQQNKEKKEQLKIESPPANLRELGNQNGVLEDF